MIGQNQEERPDKSKEDTIIQNEVKMTCSNAIEDGAEIRKEWWG